MFAHIMHSPGRGSADMVAVTSFLETSLHPHPHPNDAAAAAHSAPGQPEGSKEGGEVRPAAVSHLFI
jgi:hypothetical protein